MVASDEIINMESNNIDDRMGKILIIFEFGEKDPNIMSSRICERGDIGCFKYYIGTAYVGIG